MSDRPPPGRRRGTRLTALRGTVCVLADGASGGHARPEVCNLSADGACLRTPGLVPPGRFVPVRIERPDGSVGWATTARVIYAVRQPDGTFLTGLAFQHPLPPGELEALTGGPDGASP